MVRLERGRGVATNVTPNVRPRKACSHARSSTTGNITTEENTVQLTPSFFTSMSSRRTFAIVNLALLVEIVSQWWLEAMAEMA